jgi:hypothetical protein
MNGATIPCSFVIGWDVGGWNCDRNGKSRDAIVILDETLAIVGKPWRGNLRRCIADAVTTGDWLTALFTKCVAKYPEKPAAVTMAIDTPLGFSDEFAALVAGTGRLEPDEVSGRNRYLFRQTERRLFERGLKPLSAVKDMIGSQATKGMHVLAKFAPQVESCGAWTDGHGFRAIETYPAACRTTAVDKDVLRSLPPLDHDDLVDARVCALVAHLFAARQTSLEAPTNDVSLREGWIWIPKRGAMRELLISRIGSR